MKHHLKNYLKLGILLFGISLILVNCQKIDDSSDFENEINSEKNFIIKSIYKNEIKNNKKIASTLKDLNTKKIERGFSNKSIFDSISGIEINTDFAKYLEYPEDNYHSYTFVVTNTPIDGGLENIFLSLQSDGTYKEFLAHYDVTESEIELMNNGQYVDLEDKISIIELSSSAFSNSVFEKVYYDSDTDCWVNSTWISGDLCSAGIHTYYQYAECEASIKPTNGTYHNYYYGCLDGGDGSNNGGDGGQQSGGGGSGDPNDPIDPKDETIIVPCKNGDCPEDLIKTPCEKLIEKVQDSVFLSKLNYLEERTGLNEETGIVRTDTIIGSPNSTIEYQDLNWNPIAKQLILNPVAGQLYSDYAHTHYDTENQFSVFSLEDIYSVFHLLETVHILDEHFTLFLVTEHGTKYALKFKDFQGVQNFVNFGNAWFTDWGVNYSNYNNIGNSKQEEIESKFNRKIKTRFSNKKNEERFVKFLDKYNMGLDLYKSEDDFINWEKINLDGTTTPCN